MNEAVISDAELESLSVKELRALNLRVEQAIRASIARSRLAGQARMFIAYNDMLVSEGADPQPQRVFRAELARARRSGDHALQHFAVHSLHRLSLIRNEQKLV